MKGILIVLIALMLCFYGFSQNGQPAKELFQAALIKAAKEHKNVFLIFTATTCPPCITLKKGLHDIYNIQYFERNYVILELYNHEIGKKRSLENQGADSILATYKGDTMRVPNWFILAPSGKKLYEELGFSSNPEPLKRFIQILKKTSHLDKGELQMIYDRFVQLSYIVSEPD